MMKKEIEILSDETNAAVIRMPGRQFAGIVVQGDTLKSWEELASEAVRAIENSDLNGAADSVRYLQEKISTHLGIYERTLAQHGQPLPYAREAD